MQVNDAQVRVGTQIFANPHQRWEQQSRHCLRDRIIKGVALAAFAILAVSAAAASLYLLHHAYVVIPVYAFMGSAKSVAMTKLILSFLCKSFAFGYGLIGVGMASGAASIAWTDWTLYGREKTAQELSQKLKFISLKDVCSQSKSFKNWSAYGIISPSVADQLHVFQNSYAQLKERNDPDRMKELKIEWGNYRERVLATDLPF